MCLRDLASPQSQFPERWLRHKLELDGVSKYAHSLPRDTP